MAKSKGRPASCESSEELSQALSICAKSSVPSSTRWEWRTDAWLDVIDFFGETKSNAMFEILEEMEKAFFSKKPRHSTGSTVIHDAKNVRKDFLAEFPLAPLELALSFKYEFMRRNR